jgi:hypothetical protein
MFPTPRLETEGQKRFAEKDERHEGIVVRGIEREVKKVG